MGAKFDVATKGEYADVQGESLIGFCIWRLAKKKASKAAQFFGRRPFQTFHDRQNSGIGVSANQVHAKCPQGKLVMYIVKVYTIAALRSK
jgi:hypothetical protein